MIEDKRYIGDEKYPQIINEEIFKKANHIKQTRRTTKNYVVTAENKPVVYLVYCAECGSPLYHLTDNRYAEKESWYCKSEECKFTIKMTIDELQNRITDLLNEVIASQDLIEYSEYDTETPIEIMRLENEIERKLEQLGFNKDELQNLILECAAKKYDEDKSARKEQLAEMEAKEQEKKQYGDKQYTKYEALQRQRRLETTMRAQRQKIKLFELGGADEDEIITARGRYMTTSSEYVRFSKEMGLPQQRERVTVDNLYNIGQKNYYKPVEKSTDSGIINTGAISGALNPYSKEANKHAKQYYESVRHMTTDTKKISENTSISKEKIDKIKNHIFIQEHDLLEGHKRFDPSYYMAQSWQRLIVGDFEEKDVVLLKHEYAELRYMEKGFSQDQAHIKASKRYNYAKYCD